MKIQEISKEDKTRILEISSKIWEYGDYIKDAFDAWINDPESHFVSVWDDGVLVAFGRLLFLTPKDIWIDANRKDPSYKKKGVQKVLMNYFIKKFKGSLGSVESIRASVYCKNFASIKNMEKFGMEKISTFSLKYLPLMKNTEHSVAKHSDNEFITNTPPLKRVMEYINNSKYFYNSNSFITKGWTVYPFSEEIIEELIAQRQIIAWEQNNTILGVCGFADSYFKNSFWINYLEADNDHIYARLLAEAKRIAFSLEKDKIEILVPAHDDLMVFAEKNGFKSWEENDDFLVYEFSQNFVNELKMIHDV